MFKNATLCSGTPAIQGSLNRGEFETRMDSLRDQEKSVNLIIDEFYSSK